MSQNTYLHITPCICFNQIRRRYFDTILINLGNFNSTKAQQKNFAEMAVYAAAFTHFSSIHLIQTRSNFLNPSQKFSSLKRKISRAWQTLQNTVDRKAVRGRQCRLRSVWLIMVKEHFFLPIKSMFSAIRYRIGPIIRHNRAR